MEFLNDVKTCLTNNTEHVDMEDKKDRKTEKGMVEGFLEGIPLFGGFFTELTKMGGFQEKFKEIDKKIEENLRNSQKGGWGLEANVSAKPIINEPKKALTEVYIGEDYFYRKKAGKLILAVKVPREDVNLIIKGKILLISSNDFEKKVGLPGYFRNIIKKRYKKGILLLELG